MSACVAYQPIRHFSNLVSLDLKSLFIKPLVPTGSPPRSMAHFSSPTFALAKGNVRLAWSANPPSLSPFPTPSFVLASLIVGDSFDS